MSKIANDAEIVKISRPKPQLYSPEALISQAITSGASIETMERIMAMRDKLKAEQAKSEFNQAMANFQSECPTIEKTKKVFEKGSTTKVRYSYAPIDSIVSQTKEFISKYGLSYTIKITNDEKNLTATCIVTHSAGHSEESSFVVPIGSEQFMSDPQKYAARSTFAKRYAFCNAFGIMTGDEDKDDVQVEQKSEKFVNYVDQLVHALKKNGAKDIPSGLEVFNKLTGANLKEFPKTHDSAKSCLDLLINSPAYVS